jgi:hypothetical protein
MSAESRGIIEEFAGNPLLGDASEDELILLDSPYRRPTRIFDNRFIDFDRPLAKEDLASNSSLSTHRLLLNVLRVRHAVSAQGRQPRRPREHAQILQL